MRARLAIAVLLCCLTSQPASAQTEDAKALLQADDFTFDQQNDVFTAQGRVELEHDNQMLFADSLIYDRRNDHVIASGHVIVVDSSGQTYFAEKIDLQQKMKAGAVHQIGLVFADGSRAAARSGEQRTDNTTVLHDAVYSPCNLCPEDPTKPPLWQLRAKKVVHDRNDKDIYYHGAKMEIKGKAVAYIPYFSHPDPSVVSRSGLLTPQFSTDSKKGFMLRNYYYQNISPQEDATLEFSTTQKAGQVVGGEWRRRFDKGNLRFSGSVNESTVRGGSNDDQIIKEEGWRGHIFGEGRIALTPAWRSGFNVRRVSDDYYLRDFDYGNLDILENNIYAENFNGRNYGAINAYYFQDLRPDISSEQPDILPWIKYNAMGRANGLAGGRWAIENQTVTLLRNGQQAISKISTVPSWERRDILPMGVRTTVEGKIRADGYWVRQPSPYDPPGTPNIDSTASRVAPSTQMTASYPMIRPSEKVDALIEPKMALTLIPNVSNSGIPNEDSRDVEVNISNLFDDSRFAGIDRVEGGSHMSYGVKMGGYHQNGNSAFVTLGQSYRLADSNPFPAGSGLENDRSDFVGQVETTFYNRFYTDYRFQLNEQNLESRKHELQTALLDDDYELRTNYIFAEEVVGTGISTNRQQLGFSGAKSLDQNWSVGAEALYDLTGEAGLLKSGLALQWKNECLRLTLRGERDLTDRQTGGSDNRVLFSLGLRNLGGYDTPIMSDDPLFRPFGTERKL